MCRALSPARRQPCIYNLHTNTHARILYYRVDGYFVREAHAIVRFDASMHMGFVYVVGWWWHEREALQLFRRRTGFAPLTDRLVNGIKGTTAGALLDRRARKTVIACLLNLIIGRIYFAFSFFFNYPLYFWADASRPSPIKCRSKGSAAEVCVVSAGFFNAL